MTETVQSPSRLEAPGALVSPTWLAQHLDSRDLIVLDIRSAVDGGGRKAFEAGHIPGAVHTDYAQDGWRVADGMVTGLLPDSSSLSALLGRIGLLPDRVAVIVPAGVSAGDFAAAARVYWTLKVAGHDRVAVLDGGFAAWASDPSRPVESGPGRSTPAAPYPVVIRPRLRAARGDVERAVATGVRTLVDARSLNAFEGREKSPQALVAGRLPGAVHFDQSTAYDSRTHRLKPAADLAEIFAPVPSGPAITYCNTGHQAATDWFVLSEILGRPDISLYDGSMSEWTQDPNRPVETGPQGPGERHG